MRTTPRVSVVIPTRNRRNLLARTLSSVLGQEGVELEVIVVDEGSDDGTADYLSALGEARLVVIRHPAPLGVAAARNAGIVRASAPWVAFVDDDDLWAPTKLAAQLDVLEREPSAEWACVGAVVVDAELRMRAGQRVPPPAALPSLLLAYNVIPGGASGVLAASELVTRVGAFDPSLRITADWDLWIRLALAAPMAAVDRPLVAYVLHGENMTSLPSGLRPEIERVRAKHGAALAEHEVELDDRRWDEYVADMQRRNGLRLAPAMAYARIGLATRSPRVVARAAGVAVWPGWVRLRDEQRRRAMAPAWRSEAEAWLEPFRSLAPPGAAS